MPIIPAPWEDEGGVSQVQAQPGHFSNLLTQREKTETKTKLRSGSG